MVCALGRWVMKVRPWCFQAVLDMDELREGVQLTVDMTWSLEDATLMIRGAVCKTVRCHLFFVQRGIGAGAGNLELQNDKQGVDAIDFQKLLALPCAVSQDASGLSQSNQLQLTLAPSPGKFSTRSDDMPSLLGLTTLATAAPSKKPASEVGLEEERTPKRPRAGELAEEQAATNEGSAQPPHDGHQAAVQSAVQTPLDDVSPVQDAVHGAGSCAQDFVAGFEPEVDGEDVDESQIFSSSTVTTVAPV